jgi:hypothetical protein
MTSCRALLRSSRYRRKGAFAERIRLLPQLVRTVPCSWSPAPRAGRRRSRTTDPVVPHRNWRPAAAAAGRGDVHQIRLGSSCLDGPNAWALVHMPGTGAPEWHLLEVLTRHARVWSPADSYCRKSGAPPMAPRRTTCGLHGPAASQARIRTIPSTTPDHRTRPRLSQGILRTAHRSDRLGDVGTLDDLLRLLNREGNCVVSVRTGLLGRVAGHEFTIFSAPVTDPWVP